MGTSGAPRSFAFMKKQNTNRHGSRSRAVLIGGAALAGAALYARHSTRLAEKNHPPEGNFITVNGVRLHYTDSGGMGTALVLLHGNGMTSADWRRSGVSGKAERKYRVIAFDRPGFGYSERPRGRPWTPEAQADIIQAALEQMGVARPIVVGHSWGALVAAAFAIRRPDALRGAVLVSGYYFPTFRMELDPLRPASRPGAWRCVALHNSSPDRAGDDSTPYSCPVCAA